MNKKILFLDFLSVDSVIQVGSHKYANFFRQKGYDVFSLSHYINFNTFIRRNSEDRELIRNWRNGVKKNQQGIYYGTPFCFLPYLNMFFLDTMWVANNCMNFCLPSIKEKLKKENFLEVDVVFINNLRLFSLLKFIKRKAIVFRVSDRIEAFENMPKTILELQQEVIKASDFVFATSKNLQDEVEKINKNTMYLPNGVDEEFIDSGNESYLYPKEYDSIDGNIVLYMGAISDWFDYDLYEYGLKTLKNLSFVIIGPISGKNFKYNKEKIDSYIERYPNFYYLGIKSHQKLKNYLAHAQLSIIPFKINSLTNDINPVKFFEYSAYGLPVVASRMKELNNYSKYAFLYDSKNEYIDLILKNIERKQELRFKLIEFARENTWEKRFEKIFSTIGSI